MMCVAVLAVSPVAAKAPVAVLPFDPLTNIPWLQVSAAGGAPAWFVVDSGASRSVLDTAHAARLGVAAEGTQQVTGGGAGAVTARLAPDVVYAFDGVRLTAPSSFVLDLGYSLGAHGRSLAGILGSDLFRRYVVSLDYETNRMSLYEPATFDAAGFGESVPITLQKEKPHVRVLLTVPGQPPVERTLLVDTGSGDAVDDDLVATLPGRILVAGGVGIGEPHPVYLGRFEAAQIGSFVIRRPTGVAGGPPLIGGTVLRRFTVTLDYARGRMLLKPNRHFDDAILSGASGIDFSFDAQARAYRVERVLPGSAAEKAGLAAGDTITAIDGAPSRKMTVDEIERLLQAPSGQRRLDVTRGGRRRKVVLELKPVV